MRHDRHITPDAMAAMAEDDAERHLVAQRMAQHFAAMNRADREGTCVPALLICAGAGAVLLAMGIGWVAEWWWTALNAAAIAGGV